jgi:ribonuclease-3
MIDTIKKAIFGEGERISSSSSKFLDKFGSLQDGLGYTFSSEDLLIQALTHKSSVKAEDDPRGLTSNERLEFLGDAVIDCLVTAELYRKYEMFAEGKLSKMKSLLVSRKILGVVAGKVKLDSFVIKGKSERKNSGKRVSSIESNAFEAVIGAIYLDSGIDAVDRVLTKLLYPNIEIFMNDTENSNYKSKILEMAQSDGLGIPQYPLISEEGPDHQKKFIVAVEVLGEILGRGEGKNKKEAQQDAARVAVAQYSQLKAKLIERKNSVD